MKKLMFAIAAVAAGTVLADVTSANIVGYGGSDLSSTGGAVIAAPLFIGIGETDQITLGSIIPVCATKTAMELRGKIEIQSLTTFGTTGDEDYFWNGTNWEDEDEEDMSDVKLDYGKGYWVYNSTLAPVTFQSSGEVTARDIVRPLSPTGGAVCFVNAFPTDVKLGDFVLECETKTQMELRGKIEIQTLTTFGTTGTEDYFWNGSNWEDEDEEDMSDVTIDAGKGLWIYNSSLAPVNLRIANPIYAD